MKEWQEYSERVSKECIEKHIPDIERIAQKIFTMKGVKNLIRSAEVQSEMKLASQLLQSVMGLVNFILENQYLYLRSLAKFSFITQRIFIYLIFEGFCGEDDKDEEEKQKEQNDEDDKYFEGGMGMGDGKGGKENVSKEIEHEEQIEGLKNYESEEEKQENEEKNDQKNDEEEDNDFEMQNDFDGELEDKEDKGDDDDQQDKKSEESDEDDELD